VVATRSGHGSAVLGTLRSLVQFLESIKYQAAKGPAEMIRHKFRWIAPAVPVTPSCACMTGSGELVHAGGGADATSHATYPEGV
jgi:hypothetical protein